jgi:peptidoglycan/LPS O-acetylase OafA/YrhL
MKNRLDYLDSIRGFAALLVVFHHVFETYMDSMGGSYSLLESFYNVIDIGRVGVIVFFITSGFVIPWSLKVGSSEVLKTFAIKRFFRLYPTYWFSIILTVIIGLGPGIQIISTEQVFINFTMIHKFLGVESVLPPYWTLHLELVFYFICAFLFYFGCLRSNKCLILIIVLFCILGVISAAFRYYYQIRIPIVMIFSIGAMFYGSLLKNLLIDKQQELRLPLVWLTVFYFISLFFAHNLYYLDGWLKWFLTDAFAFILFFVLVTKIKLQNSITVYLGRISYSLYLLHSLVIGLAFSAFGDFSYTNMGFYLILITTVLGSIFFADLSYRFIEKPGVRLSKLFVHNAINFNKA